MTPLAETLRAYIEAAGIADDRKTLHAGTRRPFYPSSR